jgi:hypothetical protein
MLKVAMTSLCFYAGLLAGWNLALHIRDNFNAATNFEYFGTSGLAVFLFGFPCGFVSGQIGYKLLNQFL